MTALDFPDSPSNDQIYTPNANTAWQYDGEKWNFLGSSDSIGPTGPTGPAADSIDPFMLMGA
jgi:hypothetical protein